MKTRLAYIAVCFLVPICSCRADRDAGKDHFSGDWIGYPEIGGGFAIERTGPTDYRFCHEGSATGERHCDNDPDLYANLAPAEADKESRPNPTLYPWVPCRLSQGVLKWEHGEGEKCDGGRQWQYVNQFSFRYDRDHDALLLSVTRTEYYTVIYPEYGRIEERRPTPRVEAPEVFKYVRATPEFRKQVKASYDQAVAEAKQRYVKAQAEAERSRKHLRDTHFSAP